MKKNLHILQSLIIVKKQAFSRNLLFIIYVITCQPLFSQNPLLLQSPFPGGAGRSIQKIVSTTSGKTFFNTIDNNNHFSDLWGLWTTDGTQAGTTKLILNSPGYTNTNTKEATLLTPLGNDKIVFAGDNEYGYGELWVSDGTEQGTIPLQIFTTAFSAGAVTNIASLGNIAIYSAYANGAHSQLGKTDGTVAGTTIVYDFGSSANPNSLAYFKTIGNLVYFELTNGTTHNNEIWRTDGTTAGTYQVKDLGLNYGFASDFMSFADNIYFITISSTFGDYLWKSDGTNAGTAPLKQISTSFQPNNVNPSYAAVENNIVFANNLLYFTANDGVHGRELWKTDGTEAGTVMTFDFYQGSTGSNPYWLTVLNNQLYFTANSSLFPQGTALYFYNGSQFSPPIGNSVINPSNLTVQNNTILFTAVRNTNDGNELWVTGGSTPNTLEIANINPVANSSSNPSLISASGNNVYFAASYDANGDAIDDPCIYKYAAPAKIWTGAVNTDGSAIDNWFPSGAPANTDNVLLPVNAVNPISNPYLFCNDFINNGTTVNVGTGLCLFTGNFYNSGTINNNSGGVFGMTGNTTSYHTFGTPGTYNGQFTISSNVNMHLTANSKISQLRVEGADSIFLEDYNFIVDGYPLQIPKIIANGSGSLFMPVSTNPVTFPLSNPVTITNNGTTDYFGVSVKDGIYSDGTSGNIITSQAVNKTWNIEELTPGGSNATITLQWTATDELPGFNRNNVYLNHYTSGAWDSGTAGIASGSGPYTFARNGIISFSPFSITSSATVLPVSLLNFSATYDKSGIILQWQTSSEHNTSDFKIERSLDGTNFSPIGNVSAAGNSSVLSNYSFTDQRPVNGTGFYRLKMMDVDEKFTFSKTIAVKTGERKALQIFPNPATNYLYVHASGDNENATIRIIDAAGKKLKEEKIFLNNNSSFSINIENLPKGIYHFLLSSKSKTEKQKFIKD